MVQTCMQLYQLGAIVLAEEYVCLAWIVSKEYILMIWSCESTAILRLIVGSWTLTLLSLSPNKTSHTRCIIRRSWNTWEVAEVAQISPRAASALYLASPFFETRFISAFEALHLHNKEERSSVDNRDSLAPDGLVWSRVFQDDLCHYWIVFRVTPTILRCIMSTTIISHRFLRLAATFSMNDVSLTSSTWIRYSYAFRKEMPHLLSNYQERHW